MLIDHLKQKLKKPPLDTRYRTFWQYIHVDVLMVIFIFSLSLAGLVILFSASGQNGHVLELQALRLLFAFGLMFVVAQISPVFLQRSAPWIYGAGLLTLILVLIIGH